MPTPQPARVQVPFPVRGLVRSRSFFSQPEGTTSDCLNVVPYSTAQLQAPDRAYAQRAVLRGGSAPGLGLAAGNVLGGGSPVNLLNVVNQLQRGVQEIWRDDFMRGRLANDWYRQDQNEHSKDWELPKVLVPGGRIEFSDPPEVAAFRGFGDSRRFYWARPHTLSIRPIPWTNRDNPDQLKYHGKYYLFARTLSASESGALPTWSPFHLGVVATLELVSHTSNYKLTVASYRNGEVIGGPIEAELDSNLVLAAPGVFSLTIFPRAPLAPGEEEQDTDSRVQVIWRPDNREDILTAGGLELLPLIDEPLPVPNAVDINTMTPINRDFGFGMKVTEDGGRLFTDFFEIRYRPRDRDIHESEFTVVAGSGTSVYTEDVEEFRFEEAWQRDGVNISMSRLLTSAEYLGNLYIADKSAVKFFEDDARVVIQSQGEGEEEEITGYFVVTRDDPLLVGNEGELEPIDPRNDVVVLTETTGDVQPGNYRIKNVGVNHLALEKAPGLGVGTATIRIERAPKVFNAVSRELKMWEADRIEGGEFDEQPKGHIPIGCEIVAAYRGRMVFARESTAPHAWFMSRVKDPNDWDYGAEDSGRALQGVVALAAEVGDPITAVMPSSDDYCVFATSDQLWVLRGDPAFGGDLDNLSRNIGCVGPQAWCYGPSGEIIFYSYDGIYVLGPGANQWPQAVSRNILPEDFRIPSALIENYHILMAYDVYYGVVHIYLVDRAGDDDEMRHFWFHWETRGFWPRKLPKRADPYSVVAVNKKWGGDSAVMVGGRDGVVRVYRDAYWQDLDISALGAPEDSVEEEEWWEMFGKPVTVGGRILIGPIATGYDEEKILTRIAATLGLSSGDLDWRIVGGKSPEEALEKIRWSRRIVRAEAGDPMTVFFTIAHGLKEGDPITIEGVESIGTGEADHPANGNWRVSLDGTTDTSVKLVGGEAAADSEDFTGEARLRRWAAKGVWQEGRSRTSYPRVRGRCFFIELSSDRDKYWSFERIQADIQTTGRQRLLRQT